VASNSSRYCYVLSSAGSGSDPVNDEWKWHCID
jgi:hypothetical protein